MCRSFCRAASSHLSPKNILIFFAICQVYSSAAGRFLAGARQVVPDFAAPYRGSATTPGCADGAAKSGDATTTSTDFIGWLGRATYRCSATTPGCAEGAAKSGDATTTSTDFIGWLGRATFRFLP
jgi:hypothetical protein